MTLNSRNYIHDKQDSISLPIMLNSPKLFEVWNFLSTNEQTKACLN